VAALRYFMLSFTRNTVIAFDLQSALAFTGETGPYLQYTAVRAGRVLRRLEQRGEQVPDFARELTPEMLARQLESEDFWQMMLAASKADSALASAVAAGEPAHVARYAFQLAQAFSNFYERYPIIHEENREKKVFLLWMTDFFRRQLERTAGVLGIEIPEYM
jgi:arginyl-tRNA synthetase